MDNHNVKSEDSTLLKQSSMWDKIEHPITVQAFNYFVIAFFLFLVLLPTIYVFIYVAEEIDII
ncbi:MAG: hypothetical protein ACFFCQ_05625, partial [Promethearchaeota archaeon]